MMPTSPSSQPSTIVDRPVPLLADRGGHDVIETVRVAVDKPPKTPACPGCPTTPAPPSARSPPRSRAGHPDVAWAGRVGVTGPEPLTRRTRGGGG
jgi:hypothetical protein